MTTLSTYIYIHFFGSSGKLCKFTSLENERGNKAVTLMQMTNSCRDESVLSNEDLNSRRK